MYIIRTSGFLEAIGGKEKERRPMAKSLRLSVLGVMGLIPWPVISQTGLAMNSRSSNRTARKRKVGGGTWRQICGDAEGCS